MTSRQHNLGSGSDDGPSPLDGDEGENSDRLLETPLDPKKLSLNPGCEETSQNPLCPVCESEIRPISTRHERRFECDCEEIRQFTFDADTAEEPEA